MHGGKRAGAGRKKGTQNKVNALVREQALASGESPLDYMLRVMRDPKQDISIRNDMAKAAAPFLHPRLQAIEHSGKDGGTIPCSIIVRFVPPNYVSEQTRNRN